MLSIFYYKSIQQMLYLTLSKREVFISRMELLCLIGDRGLYENWIYFLMMQINKQETRED